MDSRELKKISIEDYLTKKGVTFLKEGSKLLCSSPLSNDKTPSFYYYPETNTFYDFANGTGGDIITLVRELERVGFKDALKMLSRGSFKKLDRKKYVEKKIVKPFYLKNYISLSTSSRLEIRKYALYRGIVNNYVPATFLMKIGNDIVRKYGVGFVLVDEELNPCGIKIRDIDPYNGKRFSARGEQKFYVISKGIPTTVYIVESETSANSLGEYLKKVRDNFVIICFGSWNNINDSIPNIYQDIEDRRLIIDFDGNKELYEKRIERFKDLRCKNICLELPKGEDINSLYIKGFLNNYKQILI